MYTALAERFREKKLAPGAQFRFYVYVNSGDISELFSGGDIF
jgi:hypothetical protein